MGSLHDKVLHIGFVNGCLKSLWQLNSERNPVVFYHLLINLNVQVVLIRLHLQKFSWGLLGQESIKLEQLFGFLTITIQLAIILFCFFNPYSPQTSNSLSNLDLSNGRRGVLEVLPRLLGRPAFIFQRWFIAGQK